MKHAPVFVVRDCSHSAGTVALFGPGFGRSHPSTHRNFSCDCGCSALSSYLFRSTRFSAALSPCGLWSGCPSFCRVCLPLPAPTEAHPASTLALDIDVKPMKLRVLWLCLGSTQVAPYKRVFVQQREGRDETHRFEFCRWLIVLSPDLDGGVFVASGLSLRGVCRKGVCGGCLVRRVSVVCPGHLADGWFCSLRRTYGDGCAVFLRQTLFQAYMDEGAALAFKQSEMEKTVRKARGALRGVQEERDSLAKVRRGWAGAHPSTRFVLFYFLPCSFRCYVT